LRINSDIPRSIEVLPQIDTYFPQLHGPLPQIKVCKFAGFWDMEDRMTLVTLELSDVDFHCTEVLEITHPRDAWTAVERAARKSQDQGDAEISVYDGQGAILIRTSLQGVLKAHVTPEDERAGQLP
jgi:hypothetical protein